MEARRYRGSQTRRRTGSSNNITNTTHCITISNKDTKERRKL